MVKTTIKPKKSKIGFNAFFVINGRMKIVRRLKIFAALWKKSKKTEKTRKMKVRGTAKGKEERNNMTIFYILLWPSETDRLDKSHLLIIFF